MAKFWKVGDRWAGIDQSGDRFMVDTKREASSKAGSSSASVGKRSSSKGGSNMKNLRLGTVIGLATGNANAIGRVIDGDYEGAGRVALANMTGYQTWTKDHDITRAKGLWYTLLGTFGSLAASKIGINRYLPKGINI